MRKPVWLIAALLIGLLPICAQAQFVGTGGFSARAILWFSGTDVTARFTGEMNLSGSVVVDGRAVPFTAKGEIHGAAEGDSATLVGVGWGIFTASGRTASGEEISLFGGLTADTDDVSISGDIFGSGTAEFFALIVIAGERFEASGRASATASGGLVPPEDPYTMELVGSGNLGFDSPSLIPLGDRSIDRSDLPWSLNRWPSDLKSELIRLLGVSERRDGTGSKEEPLDPPDEWGEL